MISISLEIYTNLERELGHSLEVEVNSQVFDTIHNELDSELYYELENELRNELLILFNKEDN